MPPEITRRSRAGAPTESRMPSALTKTTGFVLVEINYIKSKIKGYGQGKMDTVIGPVPRPPAMITVVDSAHIYESQKKIVLNHRFFKGYTTVGCGWASTPQFGLHRGITRWSGIRCACGSVLLGGSWGG